MNREAGKSERKGPRAGVGIWLTTDGERDRVAVLLPWTDKNPKEVGKLYLFWWEALIMTNPKYEISGGEINGDFKGFNERDGWHDLLVRGSDKAQNIVEEVTGEYLSDPTYLEILLLRPWMLESLLSARPDIALSIDSVKICLESSDRRARELGIKAMARKGGIEKKECEGRVIR